MASNSEMAQAFLHTGPFGGHDRIAYGVPSCVISGDSMGSENSFKLPADAFESSARTLVPRVRVEALAK